MPNSDIELVRARLTADLSREGVARLAYALLADLFRQQLQNDALPELVKIQTFNASNGERYQGFVMREPL